MSQQNSTFLAELKRLVGSSHLLTDPAKTARYRKGFRSGQGNALAVVFPGSLVELWRVLHACVNADNICWIKVNRCWRTLAPRSTRSKRPLSH